MLPHQLLIAGFHRSGTSLLAQLLHQAGLFLGDDLLGVMPSNPYGHFEDRDVVRLHNAIFRDNECSWQVTDVLPFYIAEDRWAAMRQLIDLRQTRHGLWGFKDPRVCFFLGAWKYLLPNAKIIVVFRDYSQTTFSLERRHADDLFHNKGPAALHRAFWEQPDHALRMWIAHNRALLAFVDAHPDDCLVLPFSALSEGLPIARMLNDRWDLGLEETPTYTVFDPRATQRRLTRQPVSDPVVKLQLTRTWLALERRSITL